MSAPALVISRLLLIAPPLPSGLEQSIIYPDTETVSSLNLGILLPMSTKAQNSLRYKKIPVFLKTLRERAYLTQRQLGSKLNRPQSWVYNCETSNRRVDIGEFIAWAAACDMDPTEAFQQLLDEF